MRLLYGGWKLTRIRLDQFYPRLHLLHSFTQMTGQNIPQRHEAADSRRHVVYLRSGTGYEVWKSGLIS